MDEKAKSGIKTHKPWYRRPAALAIRAVGFAVVLVVAYNATTVQASVQHALVLATTHQPERLTELYYTNPQSLPATYTPGQIVSVPVTVHNLEYQDTTYAYEIQAVGSTTTALATGSFTLKNNQSKTIAQSVTMPNTSERTEVIFTLTSKNQSIHYWVEGGNKS